MAKWMISDIRYNIYEEVTFMQKIFYTIDFLLTALH